MTKKTIQFNPNYFTLSGKKNKNTTISKKDKKTKPNITLANPNKIKKQLLMKIKEFQKRNNKNNIDENKEDSKDEEIKDFEDEFNKSLNFLQQLSKNNQSNNKSLKPRKFLSSTDNSVQTAGGHSNIHIDYPDDLSTNTIQNTKQYNIIDKEQPNISLSQNTDTYNINITSSKLKNEPPYSILKNGNKPTYRQWLRETQKIHSGGLSNHKQSITIENKPINNNISERSRELTRIKQQLHNTNILQDTDLIKSKKIPTIKSKKITKTIKRHLGKSGRKISILIKNRETRKKIQTEKMLLNKKSISEVKEYLRTHNLIKTGTTAPNYILRNLYENSVLSGEINNKSSNILLHNFVTH
jgi:hypothetical protein